MEGAGRCAGTRLVVRAAGYGTYGQVLIIAYATGNRKALGDHQRRWAVHVAVMSQAKLQAGN